MNQLKTAIQAATSVNPAWYNVVFNDQVLSDTATLAASNVVNGSVLRVANIIGRLATLQDRQEAKLNLAALDRAAAGNPRDTYDITELPTKYVGNTVVDNPHPTGLIEGRPWN